MKKRLVWCLMAVLATTSVYAQQHKKSAVDSDYIFVGEYYKGYASDTVKRHYPLFVQWIDSVYKGDGIKTATSLPRTTTSTPHTTSAQMALKTIVMTKNSMPFATVSYHVRNVLAYKYLSGRSKDVADTIPKLFPINIDTKAGKRYGALYIHCINHHWCPVGITDHDDLVIDIRTQLIAAVPLTK